MGARLINRERGEFIHISADNSPRNLYKMTLIVCLSSRGQLQEPREYMHNDTEIILKLHCNFYNTALVAKSDDSNYSRCRL